MLRAALVVIFVACPAAAFAGDEALAAEAARRFERGIKLFERGDYQAALAELKAARAAVPKFEVLFNIGVIEKKLFRYGDAVETFEQYLREGGDKIPAERRAAVERELAEIRSLVAEVHVRVDGPPAELEVDGFAAGKTPLARPLLIGPGKHTIRAHRAGENDALQSFDVVSGVRVELALSPTQMVKTSTSSWLVITTTPPGAKLVVDGRIEGRDPWTVKVTPGGHRVEAQLEGFRPSSDELTVDPGQERPLAIVLQPLPEEDRWYEHWWLWAAVGAVAVGTGATVIVFSREVPDVQIDYP